MGKLPMHDKEVKSMSEFTKSEWTYEPRRENIPFYSENGELIGIIYGCSSKSMANANLIVEAPAMYELLNRALDFFVKHDIDDRLKLDIDYCILRANGSPLQCIYKRERGVKDYE